MTADRLRCPAEPLLAGRSRELEAARARTPTLRSMPRNSLNLTGDAEADALLTRTALALVIGMVLDHQVP